MLMGLLAKEIHPQLMYQSSITYVPGFRMQYFPISNERIAKFKLLAEPDSGITCAELYTRSGHGQQRSMGY